MPFCFNIGVSDFHFHCYYCYCDCYECYYYNDIHLLLPSQKFPQIIHRKGKKVNEIFYHPDCRIFAYQIYHVAAAVQKETKKR